MWLLFWLREVAGWVLVAAGLVGFAFAGVMLTREKAIEASTLTFASFVLFRGGIHLLKVAVAARICQEAAQAGQEQARSRPLRPAVRPAAVSRPVRG
jgi:hypothetical protein